MAKWLYEWLLASEYPGVAWQVFWKLLTFGGALLLVYAATEAVNTAGTVIILIFAALWFLIGLFTKLGKP